jgi:hypothetical protein
MPHFRSLRSTSQLARDQAFAYGQLAVELDVLPFPRVRRISRSCSCCPAVLGRPAELVESQAQ